MKIASRPIAAGQPHFSNGCCAAKGAISDLVLIGRKRPTRDFRPPEVLASKRTFAACRYRLIAIAYDPRGSFSQIVCQIENHHGIVRHMENYSTSLNDVFHALADPTRRSVIARLGSGSASIKELAEPFGLGLPSFLKHIKVLESSGLIASEKVGRVRTCKLRRGNLAAAEKWFDEQRAAWESRYKNLDNLLTTLKGEEDES